MVDDFYEFIGPDFNNNCYSCTKYRASRSTVELRDGRKEALVVPGRLEVLTLKGDWQQHPVVFLYNPEKVSHQMVVFLRGGKYSVVPFSLSEHGIYVEAQRLGLCEGKRTGIVALVKEEE